MKSICISLAAAATIALAIAAPISGAAARATGGAAPAVRAPAAPFMPPRIVVPNTNVPLPPRPAGNRMAGNSGKGSTQKEYRCQTWQWCKDLDALCTLAGGGMRSDPDGGQTCTISGW